MTVSGWDRLLTAPVRARSYEARPSTSRIALAMTKSDPAPLPAPLAAYFAAHDHRDTASLFAPDAMVRDEARPMPVRPPSRRGSIGSRPATIRATP